jgi:protoheme IX farnesyltransferase
VVHIAGAPYSVVATVLGCGLIALSARFARERTTATARKLFLYSIVYLPLLWGALVFDRVWL